MHSHHSHSGAYCAHAVQGTTPRSMLHRASALGFQTYHLTEHVPRPCVSDLYPEEVQAGLTPSKLRETFEAYLEEARIVAREVGEGKFGGLRNCLVGAETENTSRGEEGSSLDFLIDVLNGTGIGAGSRGKEMVGTPASVGKGRVDYLVGSVHHARGIPIDFSPDLYFSACQACHTPSLPLNIPAATESSTAGDENPEGQKQGGAVPLLSFLHMTSDYLDAQFQVLDRLRPEVIGHLDLNRLFNPSYPMLLSDLDVEHQKGPSSSSRSSLKKEELQALGETDAKVKRNVAFAISYGALFEINSAAFRKGWETAYPGEGLLKLIISLGGRVCLSDDAHSHEQVGLNYVRARDYLHRLGVEHVWHLEKDSDDHEGEVDWKGVFEREEEERRGRMGRVGRGGEAPKRFARGSRAVRSGMGWSRDAFWDELEERRRGGA